MFSRRLGFGRPRGPTSKRTHIRLVHSCFAIHTKAKRRPDAYGLLRKYAHIWLNQSDLTSPIKKYYNFNPHYP